MPLSALTRYYEILSKDENSEISPPGFSSVNISYIVNISSDGELLDLLYIFDTVGEGKKSREVPRKLILPAAVKRSSGVNPNLFWENPTYIFGLTDPKDINKGIAFAQPRFQAFREKNFAFLEGVETPEANAYRAFLSRYELNDFQNIPLLQTKQADVLKATGFMTFQVSGFDRLLHQSPGIFEKITDYAVNAKQDQVLGQCLVTGKISSIERIHPSIKRVQGTQSTGGSIVSFNDRSYESYGKNEAQGLNAPVSTQATFAYTTALNYLLSNENPFPSFQLGDATVVYWAESKEKIYQNLFVQLLSPTVVKETAEASQLHRFDRQKNLPDDLVKDTVEETHLHRDEPSERLMSALSEKIVNGKPINWDEIYRNIDPSTRFHVLGLAPNAARISIRFYQNSPFKEIAAKLIQHHEDMYMGQNYPWSVWRMLNETVSKKAKEATPSPLMAGAVMRSILSGSPYPAALYYAVINRVRADNDGEDSGVQKINSLRAGMIKACLLRKYRYQKSNPYQEVLTMSLNKESKNQSYLLGRLFAVLEKAQEDAAAPAKLNSTIKDRYFTSACASPATTFPVLLRLSQHHISKSEYGRNSEIKIREIMDSLDVDNNPFPRRLTLDEQGIFILGYYHQRSDFFVPKNKADQPGTESQEAFFNTIQN